jgi:hypothetical protein
LIVRVVDRVPGASHRFGSCFGALPMFNPVLSARQQLQGASGVRQRLW